MGATSGDIRKIIDRLVQERQSLGVREADGAMLHANAEALGYWQLELSRTLVREAVAAKSAA